MDVVEHTFRRGTFKLILTIGIDLEAQLSAVPNRLLRTRPSDQWASADLPMQAHIHRGPASSPLKEEGLVHLVPQAIPDTVQARRCPHRQPDTNGVVLVLHKVNRSLTLEINGHLDNLVAEMVSLLLPPATKMLATAPTDLHLNISFCLIPCK